MTILNLPVRMLTHPPRIPMTIHSLPMRILLYAVPCRFP